MIINKLIELKNSFLVNDELNVPKSDGNSDYKEIQKYIANGGDYQKFDNLSEAKNEKKQRLKTNRDEALNNSTYSISVNGEGCEFYLRTSDLAAIKGRIDNLSNDTATSSWGCVDGKRVELNKAAFQSLFRNINLNDENVFNSYAKKVEEIDNITSDGEYFDENNNQITPLQELENININFS